MALICSIGTALGQAHQLSVPPALQLTIMTRTTLVAFNHANQTGNYSVLRDLGSPNFQQANNQARLTEIFRDERAKSVDLSAIVVLPPKLLQPAAIDQQGRLVLVGVFESEPEQVRFTLAYEAVAGIWRLYAIGVQTGPKLIGDNAAASAQREIQNAADKKANGKAKENKKVEPPAKENEKK